MVPPSLFHRIHRLTDVTFSVYAVGVTVDGEAHRDHGFKRTASSGDSMPSLRRRARASASESESTAFSRSCQPRNVIRMLNGTLTGVCVSIAEIFTLLCLNKIHPFGHVVANTSARLPRSVKLSEMTYFGPPKTCICTPTPVCPLCLS